MQTKTTFYVFNTATNTKISKSYKNRVTAIRILVRNQFQAIQEGQDFKCFVLMQTTTTTDISR